MLLLLGRLLLLLLLLSPLWWRRNCRQIDRQTDPGTDIDKQHNSIELKKKLHRIIIAIAWALLDCVKFALSLFHNRALRTCKSIQKIVYIRHYS